MNINTKTYSLTDLTEVVLDKQYPYVYIKNFANSDIYVSEKANFQPGEVNVTRIPAGTVGLIYRESKISKLYAIPSTDTDGNIEVIGAYDSNLSFFKGSSGGGGASDTRVGKDVSNETYIIDDVEYSGGLCGEIFNDYTSNKAIGEMSHAEGFDTLAFAIGSHSEGIGTKAIGNASHAEGIDTRANGVASHACGKYNIEDVDGKFIFIIGNGESDESRSNAFSIDYDGLIYQGNSSTGVDLSTKADKTSVYTKSETDVKITEKVAEIVADAPEDFDTLKEMSDWISSHEEDASAMNSAILANTSNISALQTKIGNIETALASVVEV